jgi:hypothetical protein
MRHILTMFSILFLVIGLVSCETAPKTLVITLNPGIDTIDQNTSHQDAGATASYGDLLIDVIILENTLDITTLGTYEITYQATYQSEVVTAKRLVTVIDAMPPVLTLRAGVDTVIQGSIWIDAGVDVVDNSGHLLDVLVFGTVDVNVVGSYIITYEATDPSGNSTSVQRAVFVTYAS